jgi:hypothetical protein
VSRTIALTGQSSGGDNPTRKVLLLGQPRLPRGGAVPRRRHQPEAMRRLSTPTLIVPGNDRVHPRAPGQAAHRLMPNSRYREVLTTDRDVDVDFEGWKAARGTLAAVFIDFLRACDSPQRLRPI